MAVSNSPKRTRDDQPRVWSHAAKSRRFRLAIASAFGREFGIEDDAEIWRADKWELLEASLVSVPADADALIRSAHTTLNTSVKGNRMDPEITYNSNNHETTEPSGQSPQRGASRPVMSDREVREAYDLAERAGIGLDFVRQHVGAGGSMDDFRNRVFERLAGDANRTRTNPTRTSGDETFDNPELSEAGRSAMRCTPR
ncbi:hypothetical protein [Bradyrhizobium sp. BR 1432]|uniref:hypothetical protein n=1 Tax=Bradyrhizobium sp. BR 1432 TaxID=3447966 RepID=UPI003EE501B4